MSLIKSPDRIAVFDVEKTLYDPTKEVLMAPFKGKLKFSSALLKAIWYWGLKEVKWISRDQFAEKAPELYGAILTENKPEDLQQFYSDVARKEKIHNDGAVELIQALVNRGIILTFITGGHEDFIKTFLRENNIQVPENQLKVFGSVFEKDEKGNYTGKVLDSNINTKGKERAIAQLQEQNPDKRIVLAAGDDEADVPLIKSVVPGGLSLVIGGKKSRLYEQLTQQGYETYYSIDDYRQASQQKVALCLSQKPKKRKQTMRDVAEHLDELFAA